MNSLSENSKAGGMRDRIVAGNKEDDIEFFPEYTASGKKPSSAKNTCPAGAAIGGMLVGGVVGVEVGGAGGAGSGLKHWIKNM